MQVTDLSISKDRGAVFSKVNLEQTSLNIYEQLFFRFFYFLCIFGALFVCLALLVRVICKISGHSL